MQLRGADNCEFAKRSKICLNVFKKKKGPPLFCLRISLLSLHSATSAPLHIDSSTVAPRSVATTSVAFVAPPPPPPPLSPPSSLPASSLSPPPPRALRTGHWHVVRWFGLGRFRGFEGTTQTPSGQGPSPLLRCCALVPSRAVRAHTVTRNEYACRHARRRCIPSHVASTRAVTRGIGVYRRARRARVPFVRTEGRQVKLITNRRGQRCQ